MPSKQILILRKIKDLVAYKYDFICSRCILDNVIVGEINNWTTNPKLRGQSEISKVM